MAVVATDVGRHGVGSDNGARWLPPWQPDRAQGVGSGRSRVGCSEDDGDDGKVGMATESELNEDQYRLLRAFNDLAEGGPTTDVAANDAARMAEFDPHSHEFDAALSYLVDVGHLVGTGSERFRITLGGINEVQRRPQL